MEKKRIGIIGGGISGTCLGYHLSLYDNAEVIVFEIPSAELPQQSPLEPYVSLTIP